MVLCLSSHGLWCSLLGRQIRRGQGLCAFVSQQGCLAGTGQRKQCALHTAVFAFSPAMRTAPAATEPTMLSTCRPVVRAGVSSWSQAHTWRAETGRGGFSSSKLMMWHKAKPPALLRNREEGMLCRHTTLCARAVECSTTMQIGFIFQGIVVSALAQIVRDRFPSPTATPSCSPCCRAQSHLQSAPPPQGVQARRTCTQQQHQVSSKLFCLACD